MHSRFLSSKEAKRGNVPEGVPYAGLYESMPPPCKRLKANAEDQRLFYYHCHHNIQGAALVADHIYPFFVQAIDEHGDEYGI